MGYISFLGTFFIGATSSFLGVLSLEHPVKNSIVAKRKNFIRIEYLIIGDTH
ncbi:hypothetical protein MNB_SV-14-488 [hydrothermal vent metagenome]|uniref:Uncharacterized protein n=1 Tax=hydrothermal vent metagenome TaxID=652676 RepID=A0A1W1CS48_9ZZZZ